MLAQNGQIDEARSCLQNAWPLIETLSQAEPENFRRRQGLARAWETLGRLQARLGQTAEAKEAAGRAVTIAQELAQSDSAYLYDLACMLALRARISSSEADAATAIATLRQAIAAGFDNEYLLRTDPRLDGLPARPDFPAAVRQGS
jgi:tetratricopeptide (TPR) repeat protein